RWVVAARHGLADRPLAAAARAVLDIGLRAVANLGLAPDYARLVMGELERLTDTTTGRKS
ncbi:MAG: ergothioneine biosynthesis glutamate--cysteine ligase EgtA, partial [Actinokineospora sp.]